VTAEVRRLGAVKAYVLGSTASVSSAVETSLVAMLGRKNVVRLGGADRYETARKVADETIRLLGISYGGRAFMAAGLNYPDATAASPIAAGRGMPILLANVRAGTVSLPSAVDRVMILGSTSAVPAAIETWLEGQLGGTENVDRTGGANRYDTAAKVAKWAVYTGLADAQAVGLATGENFPDALASGPMLARHSGVLLLTRPTALPAETRAVLVDPVHRARFVTLFIFGDTNAVSAAVEAEAKAAAGL
jgi:putative cell wall-binding protein